MCRLALMDNKGIARLEREYGLENFLTYLERAFGGHGNGFALIGNDGQIQTIRKGVDLTCGEIAADVLADLDSVKWLVFHTRLASCGQRTDENCHPFYNPENNTLLCANGTEWQVTRYARSIGSTMTDTEIVLSVLDGHSVRAFRADLRRWSSVLVGWHNGKVFAVRNCGSLRWLPGDGRIMASEFPPELGSTRTCNEFFET